MTVQAQILDLSPASRRERFMAMVLVTHDLGVVAGRADEIAVMYAGRVVEQAPTAVLFADMTMPYIEALLRSIPKLDEPSHVRASRTIPGRPPDLVAPAGRLPVRAPLPLRAGPLPRGGATAARRADGRAPVPRAGSRSGTPEGKEALALATSGSGRVPPPGFAGRRPAGD